MYQHTQPVTGLDNSRSELQNAANTKHPAIQFLKERDTSPDATFNIETYTDVPKGAPKPRPDKLLARYPGLGLTEFGKLLPELERRNRLGAAVYIPINQFDGQRCKANISRVHGCHADFDGVSEVQLQRVRSILQPTIEVQTSSPLHRHFYWLLYPNEALSLETVEAINRSLVQLGADKAATDVSRLLRLPGFKHMKYREEGRCPIVTATYSGVRYSADDLVTHLEQPAPPHTPPVAAKDRTVSPATPPVISPVETLQYDAIVNRVADIIESEHPQLWDGDWQVQGATRKPGGFESQSEADLALMGHIASSAILVRALPEEQRPSLLEDVFNRSGLADRDKWKDRPDYRARTAHKALEGALNDCEPVTTTSPLPPSECHGDIKNGKLFAEMWRGKLLYINTSGRWVQYSEDRWQPCEKNEEERCAKVTSVALLASATEEFKADPDKGKRLVQEALATHRLPRIQAMLKLAISEPGMVATDKELDSDPMLLGVGNGVVDLRTGQLLVNTPEMLITRFCDAKWDSNAQCPRWNQFVDEIFQGDADTIAAVQRLLGYTLIGKVLEEILVICHGYGANGKSIFANVVHRIFGGYAKTAPPSLLVARRADDVSPRNDLAAIAGTRYVSINEFQAGARLDEQVVKILAGREKIAARFLYQETFEFTPSFTPWLRTNHKPIVMGDEDGIWRRLVVIPFRRKFEEDEKDKHLESKLLAERDGILMWMLEGARLYQKDGLRLSKTMRQEQATYRKESDLLGEFLEEKTTPDPNGRVEQKQFFFDWKIWCDGNGAKHGSKKSFTQRMAERGYTAGASNGKHYYLGLAIPPAPPLTVQVVQD
jgi:putative DNA primase/helicase